MLKDSQTKKPITSSKTTTTKTTTTTNKATGKITTKTTTKTTISQKKEELSVKADSRKSYGPFKFKIPIDSEIIEALKLKDVPDKVQKMILQNKEEDYNSIPTPIEGDWLWTNEEYYQTFDLYNDLEAMRNIPNKYKNVIYLKNMDEGMEGSLITDDVLNKLIQIVSLYYPQGVKLDILKTKDNFETLKVKFRTNDFTLQKQYNGCEALGALIPLRPHDGFMVLGITSFDIYNKEEQNFVFGLASAFDSTGCFSINRFYLDHSFTFKDPAEIMINSIKSAAGTMIHEVGHIFGIKHCVYYNCKMNGTNSIEESQRVPVFDFCPVCIRKLWNTLEFDIKDRVLQLSKGLKEIYGKSVDVSKETAWFVKRYNSIKDI